MAHSRRAFLRSTGVAVAGSVLFDVRKAFAAPPYMRMDVGGLPASSPALVAYGNAVTAMKALPSTNPLSWSYQAAIHGTFTTPSQPGWNTCEHGSLEFLSWHRMYLYWFERIIRKQSGDPTFALPFWNYESPTERTLPAPFGTPGTGLYVPDTNRGAGWNAGTSFLLDSTVSTAGCLPAVPYSSFSSAIEGTPHAAVHIAFGSTGGWMGLVETAAQDPIFYLHHCNIDRLWNSWLAQGGGRSAPLTDTTWKTKKFLFFDEDGHQVWMTGCDILRAQDQLNYTYEGEPPQVKQYCVKAVAPWWKYIYELIRPWPPIKLPPGPDPAPFEIDVRAVRQKLLRFAEDRNTDLVLQLQDVTADRQPTVYWEVYLGLPKGERAAAASRFYVGNVALFGGGVQHVHGHGTAKAAEFELRVDDAVRAALASSKTTRLSLQFVARGAGSKEPMALKNNATVTIGRAALVVRRAQQMRGE